MREHHSHAVKHCPSHARARTQPTPDLHQKVVMKKHGSRLSEASPVWQKVSEKLKKSRLDCTCGDPVDMCIRSDDVTLGDVGVGEEDVALEPLRRLFFDEREDDTRVAPMSNRDNRAEQAKGLHTTTFVLHQQQHPTESATVESKGTCTHRTSEGQWRATIRASP